MDRITHGRGRLQIFKRKFEFLSLSLSFSLTRPEEDWYLGPRRCGWKIPELADGRIEDVIEDDPECVKLEKAGQDGDRREVAEVANVTDC